MPLYSISHPHIDIDLRYATADNLTGQPIYQQALAVLHPDALEALRKAATLAAAQGLRLRVYDAYRPVAAQWLLWNVLPDPRYVADPRIGSIHNRGVAVDLTLAAPDGTPLDMGTAFDDMTARSSHGCTDLPVAAQRNRALLLGLMALAGFAHNAHEWWHYNLPDWDAYPALDEALVVLD
ncbi:D-alanyl-D-alanine dipeptidase [Xenophilus sp. Marseille-Q4582]|uniref:D-alanyl-D-alanine dipeptidase n=1 Tax=Xenophilus sp. Marseille-Q4582 TaxID=2866600 RepID=UPI001CE4831B|nr:D-alanyl-D-alanine dipeptidase [Xenophilus sp. Marseille-Q4582]